jgi:GTP-binding protein HflX
VGTGNRLFETLDPSSRRLRFPKEKEAIITDTVGFIRDLPDSLMEAFAATLEELNDADLLLHVVDASNPRMEHQIEIVERLLADLSLKSVPCLLVLNKVDLLNDEYRNIIAEKYNGISVSAIERESLYALLEKITDYLWPEENLQ